MTLDEVEHWSSKPDYGWRDRKTHCLINKIFIPDESKTGMCETQSRGGRRIKKNLVDSSTCKCSHENSTHKM